MYFMPTRSIKACLILLFGAHDSRSERRAIRWDSIFSGLIGLMFLWGQSTSASDQGPSHTIDDLGFNAVIDSRLFSPFGLKFQSVSSLGPVSKPGLGEMKSLIEIESVASNDGQRTSGLLDSENLLSFSETYSEQGLKIKRLSAEWQSEAGTLTVGNDWANFQDFLNEDSLSRNSLNDRRTSDFVRWSSNRGFLIALEDLSPGKVTTGEHRLEYVTNSSPGVILTWENGSRDSARYRVSALGRQLDTGRFNTDRDVGWGLNIEGGWRFGDLFTALSVTLGNGINSLIFRDGGNDAVVDNNGSLNWVESITIKPSLKYSLNERSDVHLSLGRYISNENQFGNDADTLDTIHLGYTWAPWPSTRFGVEVVGQDIDGLSGDDDRNTQVKFGALKNF